MIDAYTHIMSGKYLDLMRGWKSDRARAAAEHISRLCTEKKNFIDFHERVLDMGRYGISRQVAMIHSIVEPNTFDVTDDERISGCMSINDDLSLLPDRTGGMIIPVGTVPLLHDGSFDRDEVDRAINELDLKGLMLPTNVNGKPIDEYESLWEYCAGRRISLFLHPVDAIPLRPYEDQLDLMHVLGWPYESILAIMRLVLRGIIRPGGRTKLITHHLGGGIPFFMGRILESYDRMASAVIRTPKEETKLDITASLKEIYYDTAIGGNDSAIRSAFEVIGADRIIFSTDYPWGPESGRRRLANYPDAVTRSCPEEDIDEIMHGRIEKLLNL